MLLWAVDLKFLHKRYKLKKHAAKLRSSIQAMLNYDFKVAADEKLGSLAQAIESNNMSLAHAIFNSFKNSLVKRIL